MAKESSKSLVEIMKTKIANSGNKKSAVFYVKAGNKVRVRFLQDMEEGFQVDFHDKWGEFNHPCLTYYGEKCPNCKNPEARTTSNFVWTIWNYETKRKELFVFKANKCSPIPALVSMYETYGTICDRDFVIQRNGSGTETNYSVVPMDKKRFRLDENAYSKKKVLKMLLEAFPYDDLDAEDLDDEDEEREVRKKNKKKTSSKKSKRRVVEDDEDEDDDDIPFDYDDDDDEDEDDFDEDLDDEDEDEDEDDEDEDDEPRRKQKKRRK
jgi:hypothetical protein|nr:MAG TPA: DNA binding protein like protein [Caudoviricetes sp.]